MILLPLALQFIFIEVNRCDEVLGLHSNADGVSLRVVTKRRDFNEAWCCGSIVSVNRSAMGADDKNLAVCLVESRRVHLNLVTR